MNRYDRHLNIFFPARKSNQYLFDHAQATSEIDESKSWCLPYNKDDEYVQRLLIGRGEQLARDVVTTQIRFVTHKIGQIFLEPAFEREIPLWLPGDDAIVVTTPDDEKFLFDGLKLRKREWSVLDAMQLAGHDVEFFNTTHEELKELNTFEFVHFGHFILADYNGGMDGQLLEIINKLVGKTLGRRLLQDRIFKAVTETPGSSFQLDFVKLPLGIRINGHCFQVRQSYKDTSGLIAGESAYFGLCEAVGMPTTEKALLNDIDKQDILKAFLTKREHSLRYSLYDLYPDKILVNWDKIMSEIYKEMGLSPYYTPPSLTMGATVRNLRISALCKALGIEPDDKKAKDYLIDKFIYKSSAEVLKNDTATTICLLAKTEGGRCRNNNPVAIKTESGLDIDGKGAYGEGQRNQIVPIGNPEYLYYHIASEVNNYFSLAEWLKFYDDGKELIYGAWQARIHTFDKLDFDQDFFASWFLDGKSDLNAMSKYINRMQTDTEDAPNDLNIDDGKTRIFNRQIVNGVITADGLDWINHIATNQQRNDMMAKIKVLSSMVYRRSHLIIPLESETTPELYKRLIHNHSKHTDKNEWSTTINSYNRPKLIYGDGEYHGWIALNEGDLLIDELLFNRSKHRKKNSDGSKNPKNNALKGCVNTNFGNSVSPHFKTSNTVVGNNITARCRAFVWYMEKGFDLRIDATDGGFFDINRICYHRNLGRITGHNSANSYRDCLNKKNKKSNIRYAPLAGYEKITFEWNQFNIIEIKNGELKDKVKYGCSLVLHQNNSITKIEAFVKQIKDGTSSVIEPGRDWVNDRCLEHLQNLFPDVTVLHAPTTAIKAVEEGFEWIKKYAPRVGMYELEMKDFFDWAVSHGSSNYLLSNPNEQTIAMRSYEKKKVDCYELQGEELIKTDRYQIQTTSQDFLRQLESNHTALKRQDVFVKQAILKPADYNNRSIHWQAMKLKPGDSYLKPGLLREFSLTQFTYPDLETFKTWERQYIRLKGKYGQSFEMFFINPDNSLNYQLMIETIEAIIAQGIDNPLEHLKRMYDPKNKQLPKNAYHPAYGCLVRVKDELKAEEIDLDDCEGELDNIDEYKSEPG